jgi:hypothetical protein
MLRELINEVRLNESLKNPFTLCHDCSEKERTGFACTPECNNMAIDLIEKEKGYSIYNLKICLCKEEQSIRLECLRSQEWTLKWFSNIDNIEWIKKDTIRDFENVEEEEEGIQDLSHQLKY